MDFREPPSIDRWRQNPRHAAWARGGKFHGRSQRARRAMQPPPLPLRPVPQETAAEAEYHRGGNQAG